MDPETLFKLYLEMSGHIDVINRELGSIVARLDWVEWWIKMVVGGTFINIVIGCGNFLLSRRNNRKK